jgi:hypothetical protein
MRSLRVLIAVVLSWTIPFVSVAAEGPIGYSVKYSGGSLPNVKGGEDLRLYINSSGVRLSHRGEEMALIPARAITEVSYGEEVHHRIGTAAGLAVVSLGIGAIVAFSKSKKHYVGITWEDGSNSGGVVLQADKNEYRGVIAALEGVSGKVAVDSDSPKTGGQRVAVSRAARQQPSAPAPATTESEAPKPIVLRFTSIPRDAEVQIDGEYWGSTPTADLTRLPAGPHTIVVKKLGYLPWERKVTLAPGDDRTISAELQPEPNDGTKPRIVGNN